MGADVTGRAVAAPREMIAIGTGTSSRNSALDRSPMWAEDPNQIDVFDQR